MEIYVLRVEDHSTKDVWRFVATSSGAQFVITVGLMLMPQLYADTSDIQDLVSSLENIFDVDNLFLYFCFRCASIF